MFDFLSFIDILHKYNFHHKRELFWKLNFCRMEYIPRTTEKKVHYNKPDISFRKNIFTITAEASKSEDTILFNGNR